MPSDPEPPELATLLDLSERPRSDDWSLRAALVRYAQPQPQRVDDLLDLVRRIEFALNQRSADIERDGPALWRALEDGAAATPHVSGPDEHGDVDPWLVDLLRAVRVVDELADTLAAWAVARAGTRPDAEVDRVIADVRQRLAALGVPEEERTGPPPRRATGERRR